MLANFLKNRADCRFAREFAGCQKRRDDAIARELLRFREDFVGNDGDGDGALLFAGGGHQLFLRGDERLAGFVAELERGVEIRFGDFLRRAFIHHDIVGVADIDQIQDRFRPSRRMSGAWQ